ncbi:MAG: TolC family protein [Pirellulales bacterium]|nr:TolC family protein [Pirellulales bacterium]
MSRRVRGIGAWVTIITMIATGCQPTQPFFFMEDGDLSHYLDTATDIEYPDVEESHLAEVDGAQAPLTLENFEQFEIWDLTLEDATRLALENSQVMRQLGGRLLPNNAPETISRSLIQSGTVTTTYDPAVAETGYGTNTGVVSSGTGVEAALSEYDAHLTGNVFWERNNRPQNYRRDYDFFFVPVFDQELGTFTAEINKFTADGSMFAIRNNTNYDSNNNPTRALASDWQTNIEAAFVHPLLQGRGAQYNRIAGPFSFEQFNAGYANQIDGVVIARIRYDLTLADFEGGVRNLVRDVESAYWELYFTYRNLEAQKAGQKSALATWKTINELRRAGDRRGAAHEEARARAQFFGFRAQVETMLTELLRAENRLRYIMGLATSDGRLIRPSDEPTTAKVDFEWTAAHCEALARRIEIRKQKWELKKREMELIAARNHMLPRLDAVGQYRWLGMGDTLVDTGGSGLAPTAQGSNAFESMTSGEFQEWQLGLKFSMPIGFRLAHTAVRHHQLLLARERALLQDLELEVSHQLGDAMRDVALHHRLSQTYFNQRVSSQEEVRSYTALFEAGSSDPVTNQPVTADVVLNAQRRRFEAEVAYFRSLVDYNLAVLRVHERKGSLLEYNGVQLAEGPWPAKAYFDALRRARQRDASTYFDYGFTRPAVISRGPVEQMDSQAMPEEGEILYEGPFVPSMPETIEGEVIETPPPETPGPEQGNADDVGFGLNETDRSPAGSGKSVAGSGKPVRSLFDAPGLHQNVHPADHQVTLLDAGSNPDPNRQVEQAGATWIVSKSPGPSSDSNTDSDLTRKQVTSSDRSSPASLFQLSQRNVLRPAESGPQIRNPIQKGEGISSGGASDEVPVRATWRRAGQPSDR